MRQVKARQIPFDPREGKSRTVIEVVVDLADGAAVAMDETERLCDEPASGGAAHEESRLPGCFAIGFRPVLRTSPAVVRF